MDILEVKGRIALALVESIFRRAGFTLTPIGQRAVPPHLGREDLPDFAAHRVQPETRVPGAPWLVEVRYRLDLAHYLAIEKQRGPRSVFVQARRHWPGLVVIFVTDHPETGRSCFRALDLDGWRPGEAADAIDLFAHPGLAIFPQNVEEHELLLRRMFALLTGSP